MSVYVVALCLSSLSSSFGWQIWPCALKFVLSALSVLNKYVFLEMHIAAAFLLLLYMGRLFVLEFFNALPSQCVELTSQCSIIIILLCILRHKFHLMLISMDLLLNNSSTQALNSLAIHQVNQHKWLGPPHIQVCTHLVWYFVTDNFNQLWFSASSSVMLSIIIFNIYHPHRIVQYQKCLLIQMLLKCFLWEAV